MKSASIFLIFISFCLNLKAQNFTPFPHDSLFFEQVETDAVPLMPLVKSNNSEDLILPINNYQQWTGLPVIFQFDIEGFFKTPLRSWLGKVKEEDNSLLFESAFGG